MVNNPIAYEFSPGEYKASSLNLLATLDVSSGCLIPHVKVDGITFTGELAVKLDGSGQAVTNDSVFLYAEDSLTPGNNLILKSSALGLLVDIGSAQIHVELNPAEDGVQIFGSNSTANAVKTNASNQLEVVVMSTPPGFDGTNYFFDQKIDSTLPSTNYNNNYPVTVAAVAIAASQALTRGATVTNMDSTNTIYVGGSSVTVGNGMPLMPYETIFIETDNIANIFAISAAGGEDLRWLGS